jgi:hypothetical protein
MTETQEQLPKPPYWTALAVSAAIFALYVATLSPTTAFWDTSEYIATGHILGIPHPPGNPLFVTLAKTFSLLLAPFGFSVAVRINLFAAFTSALSSGFLFLVAHRVLSAVVERQIVARVGAAAAAIIGATTYTVWNQSVVNEKVYTVSVLIIAMVSWLAVRWMDRADEPGGDRYLLAAGYLIVLGNANHLMSVLPGPSLALLVFLVKPSVLLRKRFWIRAAPLVLLGLSFNLVLPIRAAERPVINEGDPVCESMASAAVAAFTLGKAGCGTLASVLAREQYQKPPVSERMSPFADQLRNWFQYFDWQWARGADASELPSGSRLPFTLLFTTLGLLGLYAVWRADRRIFWYLASLTGVVSLGLVFYLNFKWGYSLRPDVADRNLHEVRERDYFFIVSFLLWGVLSGVGLAWAWDRASRTVSFKNAHLAFAPLMLLALLPFAMNRHWASRTEDVAARSWAYDILASIEPYGVLFTNGDNDTFPLWYLQEVEGFRKDVTVIVGQYLFTDWYPKQLQDLTRPGTQRPFEPAQAGKLYADRAAPTSPIIDADAATMDAVAGGITDQDVTIPFPGLAVTYPTGMPLDRSHRLALSIIHDSIDERPIYFATSGGIMSELRLDTFAVKQGLVSKLVLRRTSDPAPEGLVQGSPELGSEWYDVQRSIDLYENVYEFDGFLGRKVWFDRATLNIPFHYYVLALQLADVVQLTSGADERILALQKDAESFLTTSDGGTLGTPARR